jgi:hypothetical protein
MLDREESSLIRLRLKELSGDPREFIPRLSIINEKGVSVRFDSPHQEQVTALDDLLDPEVKTVIHYKPRQIGSTTVGCAFNFDYSYWTQDAVKTIIVAHTDDTTDAIFQRIRYFHDTLPAQMRRPIERSNKRELIFSDTNAGFRCLTAGGKSQGRGWTYQRLHADEMAFWPNAEEVWASITSTLHQGPHHKVFITSTANGPGGLYHKKVQDAIKAKMMNDNTVRFRFFRWSDHSTYVMDPPRGWEPDGEEYSLAERFGLSMQQLYWRHDKIHGANGIGTERFRREYPLTIEDGFAEFNGSWFDNVYLNEVSASLSPKEGELRIYEPPTTGMTYAIGVDPAWCSGSIDGKLGDWAVAQVLSRDGRQVAVLSCNSGGEIRFATKVAELAKHYNNARVLVEHNTGGAGPVVLRELKKYNCELWVAPPQDNHRPSKYPKLWTTNRGNKEEGYSHLRQMINSDAITLNDYYTVQELMHIRERAGTIEGQDGMHDDHAMALMLAEWNRKTLPAASTPTLFRRQYQAKPNPFTLQQKRKVF